MNTRIRIIVVEDDVLIAEDIRDCLTNVDYSVEAVVHNKEDAIEALDAKGIQAVGWDNYKKDSKKSMYPDYPDRGTDAAAMKAMSITPGQAMATIMPGKKLNFKKFN